MKLMIFREIDGIKLIRGFQDRIIDPEITRNKIMKVINKSKQIKEAKAIKDELTKNLKLLGSDKTSLKEQNKLLGKKDSDKILKIEKDILFRTDLCNELNDKLILKIKDVESLKNELYKTDAVYFEPSSIEKVLNNEEYELINSKFKLASDKGELIDINGDKVCNKKGMMYYLKIVDNWESILIDKIGIDEESGYKEFENLTLSEQKELAIHQERKFISELPNEEKTINYQNRIDNISTIAKSRESAAIYDGKSKTDAEKIGKSYYDSEKMILDSLFGK